MFVLVLLWLCLYTMHSLTHDEIDKLMYACNALNIHRRADLPEDLVNWMHDYISQQGGREMFYLMMHSTRHNRDSYIILVPDTAPLVTESYDSLSRETETVCQSTRFLDEDG